MRRFIMIIILFNSLVGVHAQGVRYRDTIFSYQMSANYQFGQAVNVTGAAQNLYLDIYTPVGDTISRRPLIIYAHGGGFKDAARVSNVQTRFCTGLAKRGYVVGNIDYRVGSSANLTTDSSYFVAMYRAMQDAKAAVRFFRKNATILKIDTTRIYAIGNSAGAKIVMHMAFLDQSEVPSFVPAELGDIEGNSGNAGYSSKINAVIGLWGAMWDYHWINSGDVPVYCVHGAADSTVPYDSSYAYHGFMYGSTIINARALQVGVKTGLRLFYNTGHTLDNNTAKQDSALIDFANWLYTIVTVPAGNEKSGGNLLPARPTLYQNYPNPFNPNTIITYVLPAPAQVCLDVYNLLGQRVHSLVDGFQAAGQHRVSFEVGKLPSGAYIYSLQAGSFNEYKKMIVLQ